MSSRNQMTALYSDLAPQFLAYLEQEVKKLEASISRLGGALATGEREAHGTVLVTADEDESESADDPNLV